jgi:hypothetical protein
MADMRKFIILTSAYRQDNQKTFTKIHKHRAPDPEHAEESAKTRCKADFSDYAGWSGHNYDLMELDAWFSEVASNKFGET